MTRATARRALLIVALVLLALLATADLMRHDSLIRGAVDGLRPRGTEPQRLIHDLQRTRTRPKRPVR